MQFSDLGLVAELLRAVEEQGYSTPTPIQEQAIPPILQGQDVMAGAQTGTGKTAAFTLPTLQRLKPHASTSVSPARHPVRALILTPTRELAAQVYESVRDYGKHIPLRSACVYGGVNIDPQIAELRAGIEILVATPGRLLDHVHQRTVSLGQVEIFILDEADRMLDMGFMPDIKRIAALLPAKRQNLMFSATFPDDIKRLADQILKDPARLQIARRNTVAELVTPFGIQSRSAAQAGVAVQPDPLARYQASPGIHQHEDLRQPPRAPARARWFQLRRPAQRQIAAGTHGSTGGVQGREGASTGGDRCGRTRSGYRHLPLVINYELPPNPDDYIHRIGRTGRAGMAGEAISLVAPDEREALASIEKLIKMSIPISPHRRAISDRPRPRRGVESMDMARTKHFAGVVEECAILACGIGYRIFSGGVLSSMDALYVASAERAIAPPAANVERRPRQVAALFLPPVTAKQD